MRPESAVQTWMAFLQLLTIAMGQLLILMQTQQQNISCHIQMMRQTKEKVPN